MTKYWVWELYVCCLTQTFRANMRPPPLGLAELSQGTRRRSPPGRPLNPEVMGSTPVGPKDTGSNSFSPKDYFPLAHETHAGQGRLILEVSTPHIMTHHSR